jgi:hypothetical protein
LFRKIMFFSEIFVENLFNETRTTKAHKAKKGL